MSDNKRQQEDLATQRQIEYNELLNKQKGRNPSSMKENVSPGVGIFDKLGTNERKKKQLDDERSREYNQFLQEVIIYLFRTYAGKLRKPVYRRYLCVKNNDLL